MTEQASWGSGWAHSRSRCYPGMAKGHGGSLGCSLAATYRGAWGLPSWLLPDLGQERQSQLLEEAAPL